MKTMPDDKNRVVIYLPWLILTLIAAFSLWLRIRYMWVQPLGYDQRTNLMFAVLANAGYKPYTEIFMGIPPLALLIVQWGVELFGVDFPARIPQIFLSLIGIVSVFFSLYPWRSSFNLLAGSLAAVFLSFDPVYFYISVSLIAEIPAVALAILSFVLAQYYISTKRYFWLVLSGVVFVLSLSSKVFIVFLPIPIFVVLGFHVVRDRKRDNVHEYFGVFAKNFGIWSIGVIIALSIIFIAYEPAAIYQQVLLFRFAVRQAYIANGWVLFDNFYIVGQMLAERYFLIPGLVWGVIVGWRQGWLDGWGWLSWLVLALFTLIWYVPLRDRYAVMLVPPIAVLSSLGYVDLIKKLFSWFEQQVKRVWLGKTIVGLILACMLGFYLAIPVKSAYVAALPDIFLDQNLDAIRYVWHNTLPDDCIVTDDQRFSFAVDRFPPPKLVETSRARLLSGWLTADDIVEQILMQNCTAVIYVDQVFALHLPDLKPQLEDLFFLTIDFDNIVVYTARKEFTRKPDIPLNAQFGEAIELKGIDMVSSVWTPGQTVQLGEYWQATKEITQAYKIFVQLRSEDDQIVENFDHFPFPVPTGDYHIVPNVNLSHYSPELLAAYPTKGMLPTNAWPVGHIIREVISLEIPDDLMPGVYHLYLGLYHPDTLERLPVTSEAGYNNEVEIIQIEVLSPSQLKQ